jgi:hypothetical protein
METRQLLPVYCLTRRLNSRYALSDQMMRVPLKIKPRKSMRDEFVCQEAFHSFHNPVTGTLTLYENDKIISVANELVTALFKLFVQCVEQDVGEERRKRSTLGNTQAALLQSPVHLNPGSQVPADQGQNPLVVDFSD